MFLPGWITPCRPLALFGLGRNPQKCTLCIPLMDARLTRAYCFSEAERSKAGTAQRADYLECGHRTKEGRALGHLRVSTKSAQRADPGGVGFSLYSLDTQSLSCLALACRRIATNGVWYKSMCGLEPTLQKPGAVHELNLDEARVRASHQMPPHVMLSAGKMQPREFRAASMFAARSGRRLSLTQ
ncbi:hypothetical protein B0H17DRAFT_1184585 [Mycena rosella]|uniref:Uncharacterized protein n=1 Tax=Mycena rosella TaxID=1033263 RepID=A0AAD7G7S0_MYCRO|nr:hypothetical protein B0H17DRAFT_1184585 [Mycena rosella]